MTTVIASALARLCGRQMLELSDNVVGDMCTAAVLLPMSLTELLGVHTTTKKDD